MLVGTLVATLVNSLAVTGTPALFYRHGLLFGQMFINVLGAMALLCWFGPRISQLGAQRDFVTQGEMFAAHYQSRTVLGWVTGLGMLSVFPFLAIQLVGIGKVLAATTGSAVSPETGTLLCAAVGRPPFRSWSPASSWSA